MPFILIKLRNTEDFADEKLGILWNEVAIAYRKALFHNLTGITEENHKEYQVAGSYDDAGLSGRYKRFRVICHLHFYARPWYLSTRLYGDMLQKTVILILISSEPQISYTRPMKIHVVWSEL
jgi:hypothetical protein